MSLLTEIYSFSVQFCVQFCLRKYYNFKLVKIHSLFHFSQIIEFWKFTDAHTYNFSKEKTILNHPCTLWVCCIVDRRSEILFVDYDVYVSSWSMNDICCNIRCVYSVPYQRQILTHWGVWIYFDYCFSLWRGQRMSPSKMMSV